MGLGLAFFQNKHSRLFAGVLAAGAVTADHDAYARLDITPDALPKVCMTVDQALEKAAAEPVSAFPDKTEERYRLHPNLYE